MERSEGSDRAPARIVIVEDDELLRSAFHHMVVTAGRYTVSAAVGSLEEGLAGLEGLPDVLLVDLALPDGSGLDLIAETRALLPECRILVITVFADVRTVVQAIEAGADGYLLKESEGHQVAAAIETVLSGGAPISPAVASHILARMRGEGSAAVSSDDRAPLTAREVEVLQSLANGLSFKEVAARHGISHHTVGDHVKSIYRKLQVNSRGEAVYKALRDGLVRVRDTPRRSVR